MLDKEAASRLLAAANVGELSLHMQQRYLARPEVPAEKKAEMANTLVTQMIEVGLGLSAPWADMTCR